MTIDIMQDQAFEELIEHIQKERGFDFRGYKRNSLRRRIEKRINDLGIKYLETYRSYMQANPTEYEDLLNTILINVTSFFRDAAAWEVLRSRVLPEIISRKAPDQPIRIWSAGCATGEEACSVAMLLAEILEEAEFRKRVKIYATDLDEDALAQARCAKFDATAVKSIPDELLNKYFDKSHGMYIFRRSYRKSLVFDRHDIVNDAPISNIDLLVCRNVLIYLDSETQNRLLPRLHYALTADGVLFLGKAETLLIRSPLFLPIDVKSRIFSKTPSIDRTHDTQPVKTKGLPPPTDEALANSQLLGAINKHSKIGCLVINPGGYLVIANRLARKMFNIAEADIGKAFHQFEVSYRPVELRSHIKNAINSNKPIKLDGVELDARSTRGHGHEFPYFSIEIMAIRTSDDRHQATVLSFFDTSREQHLRYDLQATNEALETVNEELQSANEEMETTNEELQSTNEELETTNEELETTNEELQSTNEELETANEELHVRGDELNYHQLVMNATLSSVDTGIIVVDSKFCVLNSIESVRTYGGLIESKRSTSHC